MDIFWFVGLLLQKCKTVSFYKIIVCHNSSYQYSHLTHAQAAFESCWIILLYNKDPGGNYHYIHYDLKYF